MVSKETLLHETSDSNQSIAKEASRTTVEHTEREKPNILGEAVSAEQMPTCSINCLGVYICLF